MKQRITRCQSLCVALRERHTIKVRVVGVVKCKKGRKFAGVRDRAREIVWRNVKIEANAVVLKLGSQ